MEARDSFCFPKNTKNPNPSPIGKKFGFSLFGAKKNRACPMGNALLYISLSYVDFGRVRPAGRTLFLFYALIFPAQHPPDGSNHSTVSYRFHSVPPR